MFIRTDAAYEECSSHILATESNGSPIENLLVQQLLVLLCADIQKAIYQAVENRTASTSDVRLKEYSIFAAKRIVRGVKKTELATFLGAFGSDLKSTFNKNFVEADFARYDAAVDLRHDIAHRTPSKQLTMGDFGDVLSLARRIVGNCIDLIENKNQSINHLQKLAKT